MSKRSRRNVEKEAFWRSHLGRQSFSGESIRGYCRRRGLSEASFHFWRREIASRDHQVDRTSGSDTAGLIAVEIVGDPSPGSTASSTLEIECPGGVVIRLREDVSTDVLQRVMRACQQIHAESASGCESVRSC